MNKDMFRGLIIGILITGILIGGGIYLYNLGQRVRGLENFVNQIIINSRQQQIRPEPVK